MGMFDWVDYKEICPNCDTFMEYQTKDLYKMLDLVSVCDIDNFYATCTHCATSISYTRLKPTKGLEEKVYKVINRPFYSSKFSKEIKNKKLNTIEERIIELE
jgi:hypothetical protein